MELRQNICNHVAAFVISFNFICNMAFSDFDLLTPPRVGGGGGLVKGGCGQNIFYHVVAFDSL